MDHIKTALLVLAWVSQLIYFGGAIWMMWFSYGMSRGQLPVWRLVLLGIGWPYIMLRYK